jgi:hypothetical protein
MSDTNGDDGQRMLMSDPSSLTTAQLLREISSLEKLLTQRLDAVDKAIVVAHENLVRVPTDVDKQVAHLKETMDRKLETHLEKFTSVQTQFAERDTRTEQTQKDSKVAVDAALQAAKEAVGKQQEASDRAIAKQEAATSKQIEAITLLISSNNRALDDKINDIKERLTTLAAAGLGRVEARHEQQSSISMIAAVVGVIVALVVGLFGGGLLRTAAALDTKPEVVYVEPAGTAK